MNTRPAQQQMNLRTWCKCPVQACKQAGCETISACKWASLQQSPQPQPTAGPCSRSLAGGHILTQCFIIHKCLEQRPVLWSQPCPNILLPMSAQCSPKTFLCCGLRNRDCSMSLEWVQTPTVSHPATPKAQRGKTEALVILQERFWTTRSAPMAPPREGTAQSLPLLRDFWAAAQKQNSPAFFQMKLSQPLKVKGVWLKMSPHCPSKCDFAGTSKGGFAGAV